MAPVGAQDAHAGGMARPQRLALGQEAAVAAAVEEDPDAGQRRATGEDAAHDGVGGAEPVVGGVRRLLGAVRVVAAGLDQQRRAGDAFDRQLVGEVAASGRGLLGRRRTGRPAPHVEQVAAGVVEEGAVTPAGDEQRVVVDVGRAALVTGVAQHGPQVGVTTAAGRGRMGAQEPRRLQGQRFETGGAAP